MLKLKPRGFKLKKAKIMTNKNEYKGYSLFNDIEDDALRNRNRAVVMSNMIEQNTRGSKITPKGAGLVLGYFNSILGKDRPTVQELFEKRVYEMGYRNAAA